MSMYLPFRMWTYQVQDEPSRPGKLTEFRNEHGYLYPRERSSTFEAARKVADRNWHGQSYYIAVIEDHNVVDVFNGLSQEPLGWDEAMLASLTAHLHWKGKPHGEATHQG